MIPKIVHYCWFGRGMKPQSVEKYIESWHKFLPDYQFKDWNEDVFDINCNLYVKEAYENRKFAFVTDYVRLYALYTDGGIYMDTDVEVLGSYDQFLHHHAFSGFETDGNVPTGMMAAEKGSIWAKELLEGYLNRTFVKKDGTLDMTTNTVVITKYMVEKGLVLNNTYQEIPNLCAMYPADYFCPKDHRTGLIHLTNNTVCIHHFAGTWIKKTPWQVFRHTAKQKLSRWLGGELSSLIADIITLRILKR